MAIPKRFIPPWFASAVTKLERDRRRAGAERERKRKERRERALS